MWLRYVGTALVVVTVTGCGDARLGEPTDGLPSRPDAAQPMDGSPADARPVDAMSVDTAVPGLRDAGARLPVGQGRIELDVDGLTRVVLLHVPPSWQPQFPAIIALHGQGRSPEQFVDGPAGTPPELSTLAAPQGLALALPQAIPGSAEMGTSDWNYSVQGASNPDLRLISVIREYLLAGGVDAARIYLLGINTGGLTAYRAAMEATDRYAGVHVADHGGILGVSSLASCHVAVQWMMSPGSLQLDTARMARDELLANGWEATRVELLENTSLGGHEDRMWAFFNSLTACIP